MENESLPAGKEKKSFWDTTIGTITKVTALLTAITGLILAVKPYFKTDSKADPHNTGDISSSLPPSTPTDYHNIATDLANQWCDDLKNKNLDALVSSASLPFYADNRILNSLPEVRASYTSIVQKFTGSPTSQDSMSMNGNQNATVVSELKTYKASELKRKGMDIPHDRIIGSLNLEDDPYVAVIGFTNSGRKDYTLLVFRKTGNTLKIAGWWN